MCSITVITFLSKMFVLIYVDVEGFDVIKLGFRLI